MSQPGAFRRGGCRKLVAAIGAIILAGAIIAGIGAPAVAQSQAEGAPAASAPSAAPPPPGRMLDLGNATCAQFIGLSRMEKDQIVLWLAGYYAGAAQRPRIDVSLMAGASAALDELCAKAPATTLIGQETRPLLLR